MGGESKQIYAKIKRDVFVGALALSLGLFFAVPNAYALFSYPQDFESGIEIQSIDTDAAGRVRVVFNSKVNNPNTRIFVSLNAPPWTQDSNGLPLAGGFLLSNTGLTACLSLWHDVNNIYQPAASAGSIDLVAGQTYTMYFSSLSYTSSSSNCLANAFTNPAGITLYELQVYTGAQSFDFKFQNTEEEAGVVHQSNTNYPFGFRLVQDPALSSLEQFKSDGLSAIAEGGTTTENSVNLRAFMASPANSDVRLEIELRKFSEPFSGTATDQSNLVPSGSTATVAVSGLANDGYHWQARAVDSQGNSSSWQEFGQAGNVDFIVAVDNEPPVIRVDTRLAETYVLNSQPIVFNFSATDSGSGLSSLTATLDGAPLSSGQSITFDKMGTHTIEITASDNASNIAIQMILFRVVYQTSGFLPPVKHEGVYKLGRTLPVKFQLTDANNQFIATAIAQLSVTKEDGAAGEVVSTSAANSGNQFRYDASSNQYIYNLSTDSLSAGAWILKAMLDDGSTISEEIFIR